MKTSEPASAARPASADESIMAEWASAYRVRLLAAAWALCGDGVEAEDLIQETFSEAMGALARFEGRSAPYTWLYGILRRRFLLHCRRRRSFLRWAASAGRLPMVRGYGRSRARCSAGDRSGTRASMRSPHALRGLSMKHREVLHLRYVEGRKIAEIAALVSASEGTVKSRLHHALSRVKSAIGGQTEDSLVEARENIHEL